MIIVATEDKEHAAEVRAALSKNDGYCPCKLEHIPENLCMCQDFLETVPAGQYCGCGLYFKKEA